MAKSRAYTPKECRLKLVRKFLDIARTWANESRAETRQAVAEGVVFSILAELDGESSDLPAFKVIPLPHPDDKEFREKRNENYWPEDTDLSGELHDTFQKLR